jgi:hypothetical protein
VEKRVMTVTRIKNVLNNKVGSDTGHGDYYGEEQAMKISRFVLAFPLRHEIPFASSRKGGLA